MFNLDRKFKQFLAKKIRVRNLFENDSGITYFYLLGMILKDTQKNNDYAVFILDII